MAILVYQLECEPSGKSYVGITARSLDTRWLEHCARAIQGVRNSRLAAAMRKYGPDAFTRRIIATADTEEEARSLETHFIRELDTYANGYNANEGGHGWLHVPEDVRRKIGAAQKGKIISEESRERMSEAKIGDSRCAISLGEHAQKGAANPRAKSYLIRCPNGEVRAVTGLRAFCRETGAYGQTMRRGQRSGGYEIVHSHQMMEN